MNPNYNHYNHSHKNQLRVNHRIRANEVRVIAADGSQIGIMTVGSAIKLASEQQLDLVEIAPEANPPVCRIVDFGKFRYEQAKKSKGDTKHSHATKLKELKFHVNIGENDYEIKLRHAEEFLKKGMRVKMSVAFRGREMQHQEFGKQLVRRVIEDMSSCSHTDSEPRLLGKNLHIILVPGKAKPKPIQTESSRNSSSGPGTPSDSNRPFNSLNKIDLKQPVS
jgi:translation initiation factor IF-3